MQLAICNNTKENFLLEPEKINVDLQNYILPLKFSENYLCFHNSWEIRHLFSRAPMSNSLWCYYR